MQAFQSSAPGRICLFGEHQDYLGWPAIVMAIDLRCTLTFTPRSDRQAAWSSPDLGLSNSYDLDALPETARHPDRRNDHLLAALIEGRKSGWCWPSGWDVVIESEVPVQAGCSSSTALMVAWTAGLAHMAGIQLTPSELAMAAHRAEVLHFNEAGGSMDQFAIALGGLNRVHADGRHEPFSTDGIGHFILGNSGVTKDTQGILKRCKTDRLALLDKMGGHWDGALDDPADNALRLATLKNRELEMQAAQMMQGGDLDSATLAQLGQMMNVHFEGLAGPLGVSTPLIDRMCNGALKAGALGAKINGSGGGGCMIAWCANVNAQVRDGICVDPKVTACDVQPAPGAALHIHPPHLQANPVLVLAAGLGSRMKAGRPKAMLEVGPGGTPFLALILRRAVEEGCREATVVVHPKDEITASYFTAHPVKGLDLQFAVQHTPKGRSKPLGAAHAAETGLRSRPDWAGQSVTVCNGDNLPPQGAFQTLFSAEASLLACDRLALELPLERTRAFAVIHTGEDGELQHIQEKPSDEQIEASRTADGQVRVSMNMFRLPYDGFLKVTSECPLSVERDEKELPTAVVNWARIGSIECIPFAGAFLDLTHPSDVAIVSRALGAEGSN